MFNLTTFWAWADSFSRYRSVDSWTFKEYWFQITKEFFVLKNSHEVNGSLSIPALSKLEVLVKQSFNYLPDDIKNQSYYTELLSSLQRAIKYPDNDSVYSDVTKKLANYLGKSQISSISWKVSAIPSKWNAPLVVTLKADVVDPEWTLIPKNNYVWWIDLWGRKKILGNWPSINYTFRNQWKYGVFVDVRSNHKNKKGYTDVLSYRWKVDIDVLSKIASVIVKVNWERVWDKKELKFTPDDAKYWLIFDATSTVPTQDAKIIKTSWDFGNGIKKTYNNSPKIERVSYYKEWNYKVTLNMETNLWDVITKEFDLFINDPIATINVKPLEWYLWDKFTFSAKTAANADELTYNWEIVDIVDDKVIFKKQAKVFTYSFPKKWYFNIKLKVNSAYAQTDDIDSKIIYISSRPPIVSFKTSIPEKNKPNRVLFDATNTFDPDYTDNWKLKYSWLIDWNRVELKNSNKNWSLWYFTFDSIGTHDITLEVTDPDNVKSVKTQKVNIKSILSVDFSATPRAIVRGDDIQFIADSKEAILYEWNFWDWNIEWGKKSTIKHTYEKSWKYYVKLSVEDASWNKNSYSQVIYVWDWKNPVAILDITSWANWVPAIEKWVCKWNNAYVVNRINNIQLDAGSSIDVTWDETGLDYSIKIWNWKYYTARTVSYKFDELWCYPIKLTVTSEKSRTSDSKEFWVKVKNLKPTLSALSTKIENPDSDPIIIDVSAVWAKDKDWVITSYLWYYYTDIDSEPQGFRVTTSPSTKFVLPKITWNYYFVLVMTDDNWDKVSSKDLWKEAIITLAWNNINVPLVNLTVNDNSVYIWEDVVFTAKVKNILWRNISSKSKYYWDFDWDWFYDQESTTNTVSHVYKKSWTFYAKVKVKHKWYSNTRIVEIDVANRLTPDFKYISIWNTFLFLNTSKWVYNSIIWDLWDWKKIQWKDDFKHIYTDWKVTHLVTLKLIEWTKIKTKQFLVRKNMKNLLETKKNNFFVLSYPENKDWKIDIKESMDYIYIYPFVKNYDVALYAVDTNTDIDSDLNWWKDDDENVKANNQEILKIKLNKNRIQDIVVFIKDKDWIVLDSKKIEITKEYIDISNEDISKIKFLNVSMQQKQQIEKLKKIISEMPSDERLKSMKYLQKLKEEWSDDTEKTKIILEFEWYLDETTLTNKDDIINLLEWLLVTNQEDKSEKNISYNALKNLIPDNITCSWSWSISSNSKDNNLDSWFSDCKKLLISKLDAIKVSNDTELNRKLWKEILSEIVYTKRLTTKEKLNFKAILSTFVYWSVKNIPKTEKNDIEKETKQQNIENSSFDIIWILKKVIYIILWIVWILFFITWLFFIYYKITNKDKNIWFSDFILKKTKHNNNDDVTNNTNNNDNLLDDLNLADKKDDILWSLDKEEDNIEIKDTSWEIVPDWLKWAESNIQNNNEEENNKKKELKEEPKEETTEKQEVSDKEKEEDTSLSAEQWDVPDWLKWSISEENNKKEESKEEENKTNIPDWLKESLVKDNVEEEKQAWLEDKEELKEENIEKKSRKKTTRKTKTNKISDNKKKDKEEEKLKEKKAEKKPRKKTIKKVDEKAVVDDTKKTNEELWDDWMEIPDWLKSE